ncbi:MAG: 1-acyl-sn-glycerol-3-phosphate acyltransferase [Desulfobacterales bacterium]|nr:1-acyl-sn-glycerol-3-phosphate acyltransferase [Desulfobacterales bacterium]
MNNRREISDYIFIIIGIVFLVYFALANGLFIIFLPFYVLFSLIFERKGIDGAFRRVVYIYGHFALATCWPYIRYRVTGKETHPDHGPVVYVINHPSAADAYFTAKYALCHTVMFVRGWPFKIPIYGSIMRRSGYVNIEEQSLSDFIQNRGREIVKKQVSMLFFPEGHRSRDGRLHRFRSGAFFISCSFNIPVIPVCIKGTEKFLSKIKPGFRPSMVDIHLLPPVLPERFSGENRAYDMKQAVHGQIKEFLGE